MVDFVLDSSALLALAQSEPGGDMVWSVLDRAVIGAVNYSEVLTVLVRGTGNLHEARGRLGAVQIGVVPFDRELARQGADLAPYAWTHGLSAGDRACLTLARHLRVPALTADRRWDIPGLPVEVRFVR